MIFRSEPGGLMFFSPETGFTGIITGVELERIKEWIDSKENNEFINRLVDLKVILFKPVNKWEG